VSTVPGPTGSTGPTGPEKDNIDAGVANSNYGGSIIIECGGAL
jgi:hypothetical protein